MTTATMDGLTLQYEVVGTGEPVVFIHGALIADAFRPLLGEPLLAGDHRLILYRRRGHRGSTHRPGPVTIEEQAADCRALLRHLGVATVHVVGHSYGGAVALQLALESPELVHSLALLEPALVSSAFALAYREALAAGQRRYRERPTAAVVDEFLLPRFGAGYSPALDRALPGAFLAAVDDAATFFENEVPGLREWRFGEAELRRIRQPTLCVIGAESAALWPRFADTQELLLSSLPSPEEAVVAGANHGMQIQNPRGLAEALAAFHARHPIAALR
jgi:3-oxoadipate enol-lactonase